MPDRAIRALAALRRLRRIETDAARRDLGEAIRRELTEVEREQAAIREMDAARRADGCFDADTFSRWYAGMVIRRDQLAGTRREATSHTADARAALTVRRLAERAAEDALARRVAEEEAVTARRDQATLEEVARAVRQAR
jgi:hypothetical protein